METIKRGLNSRIVGKKIKKIKIAPDFKKKIFPNAKVFLDFLQGKRIKSVKRKGKLLILEIDKNQDLLIHLKMTGQLVYRAKDGKATVGGHPIVNQKTLPNKFTRVIFYFNNGSILYFNDVRKFGYMRLTEKKETENILGKIGPDALTKEFNYKYFLQIVEKNPKKKIKAFLLDQALISGLGNIYTDEALFSSGIRPDKPAGKIKKDKLKKLFSEIKKILLKSIELGGTSFSDYLNSQGSQGGFQKKLQVYGRAGEKCLKCGTKIVKTKIAGRTSSYCPKCQK